MYFNYREDRPFHGSASEIGSGLDIRADGNYVVAPPSLHRSGRRYSLVGASTPVLDPPDWLMYEILQRETGIFGHTEQPLRRSIGCNRGEAIMDGTRNIDLFKYGCGLVNTIHRTKWQGE
ncbi:MAG: bifunctional DNA primase/polymerase [Acidobacteria bacterium]|nr:bifunctional DNA primase/polymerase [Acidobacteriota bacterium]